ncbi:MAG: DUF4446 family protein [Firmicutes bacterium]|nr:DUF4446 family protein [Bacillota bacterium]
MDLAVINEWCQNNLWMLLLVNFVLTLEVLILFVVTHKRLERYRYLFKGNEDRDLESVLINLSEKSHQLNTNLSRLEEQVAGNQVREEMHLQNWALIRFKAFQNTGSDQSFALALLDAAGDGVVISSLFGRDESRVYCKPVEQGQSIYPLTDEEKEAITTALGKTNK